MDLPQIGPQEEPARVVEAAGEGEAHDDAGLSQGLRVAGEDLARNPRVHGTQVQRGEGGQDPAALPGGDIPEGDLNRFMAALRGRSTEEFKNRYRRSCDVLVLEDVQFVASKRATQLELFHTLSHLAATIGFLLLAGPVSAAE